MTAEWRTYELKQAIERGEFPQGILQTLSGIITSLEAKISLADIVADYELKSQDIPDQEEQARQMDELDLATAWIRLNHDNLNLRLDYSIPDQDGLI